MVSKVTATVVMLLLHLVTCAYTYDEDLTAEVPDTIDILETPSPHMTPFPDVITEVKRSLAFVEVRTNIEGTLRIGTAFLIDTLGVVATCRHILFDTGSGDSGILIVPDTSQIYLEFSGSRRIYHAELVFHQPKRDIALLKVSISRKDYQKQLFSQMEFVLVGEIREGLDIACTGYDLGQKWKRFGKVYKWFSTHRGVISCKFMISPGSEQEWLDLFQASILVNKGASGAPVYLASDGRLVGMVKSFRGMELDGFTVNYGLADCIPAWAVATSYDEYKKRRVLSPFYRLLTCGTSLGL